MFLFFFFSYTLPLLQLTNPSTTHLESRWRVYPFLLFHKLFFISLALFLFAFFCFSKYWLFVWFSKIGKNRNNILLVWENLSNPFNVVFTCSLYFIWFFFFAGKKCLEKTFQLFNMFIFILWFFFCLRNTSIINMKKKKKTALNLYFTITFVRHNMKSKLSIFMIKELYQKYKRKCANKVEV